MRLMFCSIVSLTITLNICSMSLVRNILAPKHNSDILHTAHVPEQDTRYNNTQPAYTTQAPVMPEPPTVPVQVQQAPVITPAHNPAVPQHITVNVQLQNTNTNTVHVEQTTYAQMWQKTHTQVQQAFDWFKNSSALHKKKLGFIALVTLYASTQATLVYLQHRLYSTHWWSFWQKDRSMQELYIVPQKQLAHELLNAIQARYTKTTAPLDYATPLMLFTRELEQEICLLLRYKKIISVLEHTKLSAVFFYNQKLIPEYTQRLDRLAYIKTCFFNSLIEHKVNHIA